MTTRIIYTPGGVRRTNNKENHRSAPKIKSTNEKHPLQHKSTNILLSKKNIINQLIASKHFRTKRKPTTPFTNKTISSNQSSITTYLIRQPTKPAAKLLGTDQPQGNCNVTNKSPTPASLRRHNIQPTQQITSPSPPTTETILYDLSPSTALTIQSVSSSSASPQQLTVDPIDEAFYTAETACSQLGPKPTHIVDLTNGPLPSVFIPHPLPKHFSPKHSFKPPTLCHCITPHILLTNKVIETFSTLKNYCQLPPNAVFARSYRDPTIAMTTCHLRELLSHSSTTNNEVMCLFADLLSQTNSRITYVKPYFSHFLAADGWQRAKSFLAPQIASPNHKYDRPAVSGESVILIPFFINSNYWVAVPHHETNGSVTFMYADDLNSPATEAKVKRLLSHSDPAFYPPNTTWLVCHNTTFIPHANECGPRTLLALAAMALCPNPTSYILSHLMHPNLAQISRVWVAVSIIWSNIDIDPLQIRDASPTLL
jgi:hypothetical protein